MGNRGVITSIFQLLLPVDSVLYHTCGKECPDDGYLATVGRPRREWKGVSQEAGLAGRRALLLAEVT